MEKLSKHQPSKLMEYLESFFIKGQIFFVLTYYFTLSISCKHLLRLIRLIPQLGIGLSMFCFVTATQAGIPLWGFTRDTSFPPAVSVTSSGFATVKYTVTNNSSRAHNLALLPQIGVSQNNGPCFLGPKGSCTLILTIIGSALPASGFSGGPVLCQTHPDGKTPSPMACCRPSYADNLVITIVPHHLSMLPISIQEATANQPFVYNLKSAVQFYDENVRAGLPVQGVVSPAEQDGLRFDQASFSIVGTPKHTGTFLFKVGAQNVNGTAESVDFNVKVEVNAKDKPILKQHQSIASAVPEQKYILNLMELVEPQAGFMINNQISFQIHTRFRYPDWLGISSEDATLLVGEVPADAAGQEVEVTLIATSNTGGDSEPLTLKIPVASDPEKKPVINSFGLENSVGIDIYENLSGYINDPANDANLKVILEKVEPEATWLSISSLNPTILEGTVPDEAIGQKYLLTLRANTQKGGSSDPRIVPLQINVDKKQTPQFKSATPLIPILHSGQPFFYDFIANRDISPEFEDAPYEIKFAKDYEPPIWLRLEENKMIADTVPDNIGSTVVINITIKNVPGGASEVISLPLMVMN